MRASRLGLDTLDDLVRCELQICVLDGRVDDETRDGRELRYADCLLRSVDDTEMDKALWVGLVDAGGDEDGQ